MLQKFSSTPGLHGKITKMYYTGDWRIHSNKEKQIKTDDFKPFRNLLFSNTRPNCNVLSFNLYLDQLKLHIHEANVIKCISQQKLRQKKKPSYKKYRQLLVTF